MSRVDPGGASWHPIILMILDFRNEYSLEETEADLPRCDIMGGSLDADFRELVIDSMAFETTSYGSDLTAPKSVDSGLRNTKRRSRLFSLPRPGFHSLATPARRNYFSKPSTVPDSQYSDDYTPAPFPRLISASGEGPGNIISDHVGSDSPALAIPHDVDESSQSPININDDDITIRNTGGGSPPDEGTETEPTITLTISQLANIILAAHAAESPSELVTQIIDQMERSSSC